MGETDGSEAGKKEAKMGHTPLPWRVRQNALGVHIEQEQGISIATCWRFSSPPEGEAPMEEANGTLIVRAVNAHYDLLEALERLVELGFSDRLYSDEEDEAWENVEKAIQKARGEVKGG